MGRGELAFADAGKHYWPGCVAWVCSCVLVVEQLIDVCDLGDESIPFL